MAGVPGFAPPADDLKGYIVYTYIYVLCDPITTEIRYCGKANNPQKRYEQHCKFNKYYRLTHSSRKHTSTKDDWIQSLLKADLKPVLIVIDKVDINNWKYVELSWINDFIKAGCALTNGVIGGGGSSGKDSIHSNSRWSNENKVKFSKLITGRKSKTARSKYPGVAKSKDKWAAFAYKNSGQIYLGRFDSEELAYKARCEYDKSDFIN